MKINIKKLAKRLFAIFLINTEMLRQFLALVFPTFEQPFFPDVFTNFISATAVVSAMKSVDYDRNLIAVFRVSKSVKLKAGSTARKENLSRFS